MSTAKWANALTESSNIAGTALNSIANGSASGILADVSGNNSLNLLLWIELGSITPAVGGSIAVRLRRKRSSTYEDATVSQIVANPLLLSGASAKKTNVCVALPGPFTYGVEIINYAGVALNASGNAVYLQEYSEDVS